MKLLNFDVRWLMLNVLALVIMILVVVLGDVSMSASERRDSVLESGKWAVRFLLFCLAMTPLNTLFGWRYALKFRKSSGLWAFGFAALHVTLLYIHDRETLLMGWLRFPMEEFVVLGLTGLIILAVLTVTSNRWAQKWLGKNWKRLHRLVYLAAIAVVFHAILATVTSKKMFVRDPLAHFELKLYLAILIILLILRIPPVRHMLIQLKQTGKSGRRFARRTDVM